MSGIETRPAESWAHGTRARYVKGCRCADCRRANSAYATAKVPHLQIGKRRRVRASTALKVRRSRSRGRRAAQKIRSRSRGWIYAVEQLVDAGAEAPGEDLRAWLPRALEQVTHTVRHPGNHRYAWGLNRSSRRELPASMPYPRKAA